MKSGWTLIELMVTVVIIGILLAMLAGAGVFDKLIELVQNMWRAAT